MSNQQSPSWSHARGGQTQSASFAHAGQALSSDFGEIVRHHAAVLAAEPRRRPASSVAPRCASSRSSHHAAEAGAPHGGVDELLQDKGGEETRQVWRLPNWRLVIATKAKGRRCRI